MHVPLFMAFAWWPAQYCEYLSHKTPKLAIHRNASLHYVRGRMAKQAAKALVFIIFFGIVALASHFRSSTTHAAFAQHLATLHFNQRNAMRVEP
jgi:hypothetical protein